MLTDLLREPAWTVGSAAAFGLLIGSFLNVVILRIPKRLEWQWLRDSRDMLDLPAEADGASAAPPGIVVEGSHCPHCSHKLGFFDNIPVLSFVMLRGRCRFCRAPISWQYPAVELLTALAFAACAWHFGATWQLPAALAFTGLLIALAGIDLHTQLLPDQLTQPLLWLGLLASTVGLFVGAVPALLGAVAGYLSLWSVFWVFKLATGKEGMGRGDFKLLAALGAWCGVTGVFPIVLMSAVLGAVIGSAWMLLRGTGRATPIPFGPYLAVAGWIQLLWGQQLVATYLRLTQIG